MLSEFVLVELILNRRRDSATEKLQWLRKRSVNLEARRGAPNLWLVAHLDSKSQTVPMLVRVSSHVLFIAVLGIGLVVMLLAQWRLLHAPHWDWIALAATI